ncbi:Trihelix transcription factor ASR3 [Camellia lanceoleosa]|uniref:Trihelix transcription factor ASR3 n=1 Tax=Camellia lanceoleosa TaxID=1840588 RepID=A0ACC0FBL9_9ERIC|nr:Trihelix transcription factor ASR3 [Camellia lanceoleosa]
MATESNNVQENDACPTNGVDGQQATAEGTDDKSKSQRLPRWTRQETLILIEGKQVAENRDQKGHQSISVFGSDQLESKWDTVSSFCRGRGVNRGPVKCRKRWSNLVGDFRKIKTWDSQVKEEAKSFWMLGNDSRREKKLPGFFDREVYDVLDGKASTATAYPPTLVTTTADAKHENGVEPAVAEGEDEEEEEEEAAEAGDGLFSDFRQLVHEGNGRSKENVGVADSPTKTVPAPMPMPISGVTKQKQQGSNFWRGSLSQEGWKRRRLALDGLALDGCEDTNLEERFIKVLEKNSNMLNAQLVAQNINYQLDREERKEQNDSLLGALSKITDALGMIANKL